MTVTACDPLGVADFPLAFARGTTVPFVPRAQPPQYLPSAALMDDALDSAFAQAAEVRQATIRRASVVATWLCDACRTWTRPSRGPSPDVCDAVDCRRPRPAYRGRPAPGALA